MFPGWRIFSYALRGFAIGSAIACVVSGSAAAGYIMPAGQSKQLNPLLSQRPMDVYVATGPAGACGPGCSEWIAVEGRFDEDAGGARTATPSTAMANAVVRKRDLPPGHGR